MNKIQSLFNYFAQSPHSRWIMEYPNAVQLYNWVKTHPIKKVLDLGTGIGLSASVVSLALQDKKEQDYEIISLEQFDKCISIADKMIPEQLKKGIKIIKTDVEIKMFEGIPYQYFSNYKAVPDGDFDLIINDGPAPTLENNQFVDMPNGTIIKMLKEGKLKVGTSIVYDGRTQSLKLLERYYGDNFVLSQLAPRGNDFNVLEVVDGTAKLQDEIYDLMKQTGYFNEENTLPTN